MSLIRLSSVSAEVRATRAYRRCCASNGVDDMRSSIPTTPFSGVRISWLMFARNSLLARLAASAASFCRCNSSDCLRCVMSSIEPSTDSNSPAPLRTARALIEIQIGAPSRRTACIS